MEIQELNVEQTIQQLTEKGYTVRDQETEKLFADTFYKSAEKKIYDQFDNTILETTKSKKDNGIKSTEYLKNVLSSYESKVNDLSNKLKEYEGKGIESSEIAQEYKKRVEILEKDLTEKEKTYLEQINSLKGSIFESKHETLLNSSLSDIKVNFRKDIDEQMRNDIIIGRLAMFKDKYKPKELEGMIVYTNGTDEIVRGKDGKPKSTDEILNDIFAEYREKGRKLDGTGAKQGESNAINWPDAAKQNGVTTLRQLQVFLTDHFSKLGKDNTSPEFNAAYREIKAVMKDLR